MDAPPQLKMVPASIDLQKISEQGVRTHPPMVLLAFISNVLCILFWVLLCWARCPDRGSGHIPVFSLCRRRGVDCDRLFEVTQEGPVEHASDSVDNDDLCFATKTFG